MAVENLVTRGFGTGNLTGSVPLITLRGYGIGEESLPPVSPPDVSMDIDHESRGGGGLASRQRRKRRERDDQDFLDLITLALPEIMKRLK